MKLLVLCILLSSGLLGSSLARAEVWPTQNQWDAAWEDKFSAWVESSWDDEIFKRPDSVVYNIATDCADATYTMRALYSYLNHLPFQILNPVKDVNAEKFITNSLNSYDQYPVGDERFRAFIRFVNKVTGSKSLADDTYPIAMNRKYMRAGAVYVAPSDHTYQMKSVDDSGVPVMYSSTVPQEVRYLLILKSFPMYMPGDFKNFKDGFRVFKQPQHYGQPESELPGYDLQQFEISKKHGENILTFGDEIASILAKKPETLDDKMRRTFGNMSYFSQLRGIAIGWTLSRKEAKGSRCFTKAEYEDESTTSRDKKLKLIFEYAEALTKRPDYPTVYSSYKVVYDYIFYGGPMDREYFKHVGHLDPPVINLEDFSLKEIWEAIQQNKLVDDPNATLKQRWGLEPYTRQCPG